MKNRSKFILVVCTVVLLGMLAPVHAWGRESFGPPGGNRPPMNGKPPIEGLARMLDLTSEQKANLLDQDQALERDILPFRQKIETMRMKLEEEMGKDNPDRQQIESYIKEINQNRLQIELKRTDFMLKFRQSLSADQKAKLKKIAENEKEKFKQREEKGLKK